jgi:hypothetical protein
VSRGCEEWGKRGAGKRGTGGDRGALKGRGDRLCGEERWGWDGGYGERRHAAGGSGGIRFQLVMAPARQWLERTASSLARRRDRRETGESWGLTGGPPA